MLWQCPIQVLLPMFCLYFRLPEPCDGLHMGYSGFGTPPVASLRLFPLLLSSTGGRGEMQWRTSLAEKEQEITYQLLSAANKRLVEVSVLAYWNESFAVRCAWLLLYSAGQGGWLCTFNLNSLLAESAMRTRKWLCETTCFGKAFVNFWNCLFPDRYVLGKRRGC